MSGTAVFCGIPVISLLFINRVLKATNNKFGEMKFASCAKKKKRKSCASVLPLNRMSHVPLKLFLQSTELWLAKKRHENLCIQRIKNCMPTTSLYYQFPIFTSLHAVLTTVVLRTAQIAKSRFSFQSNGLVDRDQFAWPLCRFDRAMCLFVW